MTDRIVVQPDARRHAVLDAIRSARHRLVIAIFRWDDHELLAALADAAYRGVRVEALLTRRVKGWKKRVKALGTALDQMQAGVHQFARAGMKYHAKYLVVDDGPAYIASFNFTHACFSRTVDYLLVTSDPAIVSGIRRLFEGDCDPDGIFHVPPELSGRLIVGPEFARERLTALIRRAHRRIQIVDSRINDPAMTRLLTQRLAEGIEIRVAGRGDFGDIQTHGRMMIIDGEIAVTGSISLSPPSLDLRRELAVVSTDPLVVSQLAEVFARSNHRPFEWPPVAPVTEETPP